ncbi:transcriptional regulator, AbrB family [Syntrophobotulus glycolicus DSM 8271]|uniref:Transcriptional regulator, AbrB family n=1 Tax=Syntrophobotulus glycolicus (strain DSM 8271 / FlGlyR) TaxID=645991 RepID=F0SXD9_SYNGF|nr:AbrB/MazE/SpoVT family DNA-binding domain-containing protein [Syntrophobotulus glycolicus]ADY54685.1 transcriptional regulator, AbrB family [Syntrophobotulus glycolicus DSM 8271]
MKSTGIVRKVDEFGRVVLPAEIRRTFKIWEKDPLEIYIDEDKIILKKYTRGCHCCGSMEDLSEVQGLPLCSTCIERYHKAMTILRKEGKAV